ncbi:hypothetical protein QF042_002476 [Pedobacter sp. W3I1]|uniref:hypothetical protein n=1 Tax=Pedobacter sp. W3I1 TaxID=3042291 RepID=UPI00278B6931|nr:hypothetical protein [Pedobacter sp. W3I1]MDQ0638911.1 hypothetical protein [Pedobacter sp. W3I1]
MKSNKLSELTITELNKQKKQLSGLLIGSAIIMLFLFATLVYLIVKKQNFVLLAVIPGCLIAWLPVIIKLSQLNAEIKLRNSEIN